MPKHGLESQLRAWRRNDWRFLTGVFEPARLGYIGALDERRLAALRLLQPGVRPVDAGGADARAFDLVFVASDSPIDLAAGFAAVAEGGALCVEVGAAAVRRRAAPLARVLAHARRIPGAHPLAYWSAPDLERPARLVPLHDRAALDATLRRHDGSVAGRLVSFAARLASRARGHWLFARQGYVVVARSREPHPVFGDASPVLVTPRFDTSRHVVAMREPVGSPGSWVVKIPRQPGDDSGIRREGDLLEGLRAAAPGLGGAVPRIDGFATVGATRFLRREAISGSPLDPAAIARDPDAALAAGLRFVDAMPRTREPARSTGWYEAQVVGPLARLVALSGQDALARLASSTHEALAAFSERPMPAVFEHGDLSHPNLLRSRAGELRVLDWERAREHGVPGHDLVFYLQYWAESSRSAFTRDSQRRAFDQLWAPGGRGRPALTEHLRGHGLDFDPGFVLLAWARSSATLAERLQLHVASAGDVDELIENDRDVTLWRHALDWYCDASS
ncbi:aminoglycoside phosphotransferase family protein [Pseudoclavibacter helvolus]|uniref:aminoglycoside phosphotransferase family protein n=1 Tax=Pseudoclavibacter helvolus TaxID=255205 RepID=UPI003C7735F6